MSPAYIDDLIGGLMDGDGGGLELKRRGGVALRDPIKPCAYFNPGVKFDSSGKATCRFKLPGNLTSWKVMVTVDDTTCFGSDTISFTTNKPLMIRPQLGRIYSGKSHRERVENLFRYFFIIGHSARFM